GYYFEPMSERYQAMLEVALQSLDLPEREAEAWLDLPPSRRGPWLERADLRAGAALLLLEQAALRREELLARDALKQHFMGGRGGYEHIPVDLVDPAHAIDPTDPVSAVRELLKFEGYFSRPASLLPQAGYGLPQREERDVLAREGARRAAQWLRLRTDLRAAARQWLPVQRRDRLQAIEANLDRLGARLRRLHEAQGGLRLRPETGP